MEKFRVDDPYDLTLREEMFWKRDEDLLAHFIESCFFHYLPKDCSVSLGWRSPLSVLYFLKDFIKDKHHSTAQS